MRHKCLLIKMAAVVLVTLPAFAHHSFAMFDAEKTVALEGSVKKLQWTNPHSWLYLTVVDAQGQSADWTIELGSPGQLVRQGWTPTTLATGMKINVLIHPLLDGKSGGQFVTATLPDGHKLGESGQGAQSSVSSAAAN